MYSRKKGKSRSHRPQKPKASWVKYKPEEIEEIIVKLAKSGNSSAKIGLILRDQYGIPTLRLNKAKISQVLKKHNIYPEIPDDLFDLFRKAVKLYSHMDKNKKDYTSKRGLELTESKIRRLAKFYIRNKALPPNWKYDAEQVKLLVK